MRGDARCGVADDRLWHDPIHGDDATLRRCWRTGDRWGGDERSDGKGSGIRNSKF